MTKTVDPILASVIQRRLYSITQDMANVLKRTSRSPVFNEAGDFVTGLFDNKCRMVEQSANIPIIGFGAQPALPNIMEEFEGNIFPGDIIVHNDVFEGGNQTHDVGIYKPIFWEGELVGWAVSKGHLSDIGGATLGGYNPNHTEVWQEAIRIPGLKVVERGKVIRDVWKMLFANVRLAIVEEDVKAMIGACNIGEREYLKTIEKYSLEKFRNHLEYVFSATEKQVKEIISTWKEGEYFGESYMVSDGQDKTKKYKVRVKLTIKDKKVHMDFTGTAKQAPGFTNMPPASAKAACSIAYLMLINPGSNIAQNEGLFSSLDCYFPKGSIVNPNFPAATLFGNQMADVLLEAIMKAFMDAVPDNVTASWSNSVFPNLTGYDSRKETSYFTCGFLSKGGQGALKDTDGFDGIGFAGCAGSMISQDPEMFEIKDPVFLEAYEYSIDSAGSGEFRGGYGTYLKLRIEGENNTVGLIGDGMESEGAEKPQGLKGGLEGTLNVATLYFQDGKTADLGGKDMLFGISKGTILEQFCGGGGGYGNPLDRPVSKILKEVESGLLSIEKASRDYKLVISEEDYSLNEEATLALRAQ